MAYGIVKKIKKRKYGWYLRFIKTTKNIEETTVLAFFLRGCNRSNPSTFHFHCKITKKSETPKE